jgi:GTPase SAR1 family protein
MVHPELAVLNALGQLETHMRDMSDLSTRMEEVPLWQPAHALAKQAVEARHMIAKMRERIERHLVVTLIGPSGAGKSTLLNALAGVDELSPTGGRRPTTQELVVLSNDVDTVHELLGRLDEQRCRIKSHPAAEALTHMILVDTPDTDSVRRDTHLPLITHAVEHSDVLICVFDAQNPKRRDHADFMAPLVQRFHGASLVAVVNKCDRQDPQELSEVIAPEFKQYLAQAWDTVPEAVLLVSARRHLQNPQWDPQAAPRHDLDQFEQLRALIFDTFNRPGAGPDRRLANARRLREFMVERVRQGADQHKATLHQALQHIAMAEQEALREAMASLRADDRRLFMGMHLRLYQSLAQRWVGPVGWLVALWSRLLLFGTGLASLVRFGNPVRQIWGLISSYRRYKESSAALGTLNDQTRVDGAMLAFRKVWLTHWPQIGELLVQAGFDPRIRRVEGDDDQGVAQMVSGLWSDTLDAEIERSAGRLSHFALQLLFNAPSLALLGYVGWLTASRFLVQSYMSGDFFMHALLTIVIVLLLSFFVLQAVVRIAVSRDRIQKRAFGSIERAMGDRPLVAGRKVSEQVHKVLELAG